MIVNSQILPLILMLFWHQKALLPSVETSVRAKGVENFNNTATPLH